MAYKLTKADLEEIHREIELLQLKELAGMDDNVALRQQVLHNRPHSSRTNLYSANNLQSAKASQDVEKKRTRRRPRTRKPKDIVDNASSPKPSVNSFPNKVPVQTSSPSTSKSFVSNSKNSNQEHVKISFAIKAAVSRTGYFLRKRNPKEKHINLKSFLTTANNRPCVFTTNSPTVGNLTSSFTEMCINRSYSNISKSQCRKYPQNIENGPSTSTPSKRRRREKKKEKKVINNTFTNYINVEDVTKGLANGDLVKGFIRINPKNFKDSYVSNGDRSQADYYLTSVVDRNKALEGDEVIIRLKPEKDWINGKKTAAVVCITQLIHSRITIGVLKPAEKHNAEYAVLFPRDKRIPILRIPPISWPTGFGTNPKQYEKTLFVAKIVEWDVPSYAVGVLTENLGLSGDLKVETKSILREFCLDITPFGPDVVEYLPKSKEIPASELEYREDIRKECVFTIDPATARDLDDALSVKQLPDGNYEIGVHISDASFYLEEGTELDQIVSKKATTIYLVDNVHHMLPEELCLHCSLLPGADKLSFSVFWEMTEDGDVVTKRFARTIVNSCAQLAYEHAQMIIENPDKEFKSEDFPPIHNGFSVGDIQRAVLALQKIAVKLRERRVENGALKIDQVKLSFSLNPRTGEPQEYWVYENKEAHRLIEEFMLLANISVAERISEVYPDIAFLRCHEPPKQTMLVELKNNLATCGIHIDISSSGGIHGSMKKYITDDFLGQCRGAVLNHITAKAMTRARYFCASTIESELDYKHYALSVPIYTHFTSPIRRYADVMAHRLLAATLDYCEKPEWDADYVSAIAANCNGQKYNAKRAGEASSDLYLAHYVEKHQPFEQNCVVIDVKEKAFDVIVLKTGSIVRIYQNNCEEGTQWTTECIPMVKQTENQVENGSNSEKKLLKLTITFPKRKSFPETVLIVEMFTMVKVNLGRKAKSNKLEGTLLRPVCTQTFTSQLL